MRFVSKTHDASKPPVQQPSELFGITEIEGGFPHSEIRGSKVVRTSPRLIAAYHVLHRLSAPRHPPNTLKALDRSHYQRPPLGRGRMTCVIRGRDRKTICFKHIREHRGQALFTNWQLVFSSVREFRSFRTNAKKPKLRSINDRICFLFTMTDSTHSALSAQMRIRFSRDFVLPEPVAAIGPSGGARRDRTDDLMLAKHALYQLSYGPIREAAQRELSFDLSAQGSTEEGGGPRQTRTADLTLIRRVL